jgi:hypothetical protein
MLQTYSYQMIQAQGCIIKSMLYPQSCCLFTVPEKPFGAFMAQYACVPPLVFFALVALCKIIYTQYAFGASSFFGGGGRLIICDIQLSSSVPVIEIKLSSDCN